MAGKPPVTLNIDQHQLVRLRQAMAREADGKALRKDLIKDLRSAALPGVPKLQAAVRELPDVNPVQYEPRLRESVAKQVKVAAALGGKNPGVKFRVGATTSIRGFKLAGRRLNSRDGWRHPVFAKAGVERPWVTQVGNNGERWFEPTILRDHAAYQEAVRKAIDAMARRIASKTTRG